jgi:hypothetical protein
LSKRTLIFILITSFFVTSCYTRKLNEGEYLLDKNKILTNSNEVDKEDLESVIRQRPNKKIFSVVKFHLALHNLMDSAKVAKRELRKIERKNKRINRKNKRKTIKNKQLIQLKTTDNFDSFGEKILYSIGEPPVIFSKTIATKTADQLHIYLIRKGFFNNTVSDSIHYIEKKYFGLKKKRAEVFYTINVSDPYRIKSIEFTSKDSIILQRVERLKTNSKLKEGDIFDIDKMDDERDRITTYMSNNGFYQFNKNYIKFFVDSSSASNEVTVVMQIDLFKEKIINSDSISATPHAIYKIGKINVRYTQDPFSKEFTDFLFKSIDYRIQGVNDINANLFYQSLFIRPGDIYSKQRQQQTFKKLVSLGVFQSVNIVTEMDTIGGKNELIVTIITTGAKRKGVKAEWNGTTSGSNFGVEGSLAFSHNNVFRGAERFDLTLAGALESQPLFLNDNTPDNSNIPIDIQSISSFSSAFNTIEFGPNLSLTLPKLLFFDTYKFKNISNTKTVFSASLNYQRRLNNTEVDFERSIQEISYGYSWVSKNKFSHLFEPLAFSAIEVDKSEAFDIRINSLNDKLLAASFQNHIISSSRYRFVYNTPPLNNKKRVSIYYDGSVESAGNILNAAYKLAERPRDASSNSFEIVGIQFAQYVKTQHDFRVYNKINDKSSFVFRFVGGIGVPMENLSDALPFEKSFFAGGTDKTRAWKARSLGPGGFRDSSLVFDKIGEILIEGNMEYRFDLLGFLDGAFFVDAGNIWLMNEDSLRPNAEFRADKFVQQIAVGAGFGIRIDLSFFLIRLDIAYPLKNPSLIEGERWFFQPKTEYENFKNSLSNSSNLPGLYTPQINIGIGYPF